MLECSVWMSASQRYGCAMIIAEKANRIEVRRYPHSVNHRPNDQGAGDILVPLSYVGL